MIEHSWFEDGILNVTYNCLDRHLEGHRKLKPAIIWQEMKSMRQNLGLSDITQPRLSFCQRFKNGGQ